VKAAITILLLVFTVTHSLSETPRLLLIASNTTISKQTDINLDVYVYNDSKRRVKVPSLEYISTFYVLRDPAGIRLPRAGTSAQIFSHPRKEHSLRPNGVEQITIKIEVPAEIGDLAEVYVELGRGDHPWRSNSVLLFRPTEDLGK
jgi:hypothetical protein